MDQKHYRLKQTMRLGNDYPKLVMADGCMGWNVYDKLTNGSLIQRMSAPYCNGFYVVIWNVDARLTLSFNGQTIEVPAKSLLCIPSGRLLKWQNHTCSGFYTFVFSEDLFNMIAPDLAREARFMLFDTVRVVGPVGAQDHARFKGLIDAVKDEIEAHRNEARKLRRMQIAQLSCFLAKLMDIRERCIEMDNGLDGNDNRLVNLYLKFIEMVEGHFITSMTITGYLKALGVSRSVLYRAVKTVAGQSPMAIVRQRRLDEAKRLLCESEMSVNGIAKRLGFRKLARFDQFFLTMMGVSPSDYRKSCYDSFA